MKPLTREEALQWCVDNLDYWPYELTGESPKGGWGWRYDPEMRRPYLFMFDSEKDHISTIFMKDYLYARTIRPALLAQVTKGADKMTLDHGTDFISIKFSGEDKKAAIRLIRKWLEIIEKST